MSMGVWQYGFEMMMPKCNPIYLTFPNIVILKHSEQCINFNEEIFLIGLFLHEGTVCKMNNEIDKFTNTVQVC